MPPRARKRQGSANAKPAQAVSSTPIRKSRIFAAEWLGWAALAGLTLFYLSISWRKWPDTTVDFGRELYVPWRLTHGAVLYRDIEDNYGPLSQYLNAGVFALFGPGIMALVTANLGIFAGIIAAIYTLFRRAWGAGAAFLSSALFISVFGFAQYVGVGNYNYATPYAHEATHGLFVCLLLVLVLGRWVELTTILLSSLAGVLLGLTALLKPEIMLAAALVTLAAAAMRAHARKSIPVNALAAWAGCVALPSLAFTAYFSAYVPWTAAWKLACHAWLNLAVTNTTADPIQKEFLGLDHVRENLVASGTAILAAALLIAGIAGIAWLAERRTALWQRYLLAATLLGAVAWLAYFEVPWLYVGRCFLGLTIAYILVRATLSIRGSGVLDPTAALRLLIALLAAALMLRMLLNGRLYQYGFYQAALAGVLIPAVIVGELPVWLKLRSVGKGILLAGTALLLGTGALRLTGNSQAFFQSKTYAIGEGEDRFYAEPYHGEIIGTVVGRLGQAPAGQTLLVLPEGQMINYLVRMPSPVAAGFFAGSFLSGGREAALVEELKQHSPDWVVILTRDLGEYGITHYGESPGKGQQIMQWVSENYEQDLLVGDDPRSTAATDGAVLLGRKRGLK
jgi:hypothetical protein